MRIFLSTLGVFFLMSFLFIMPAVLGPSTTLQPSASPVLSATPTPSPAVAQEIRAVWVSFLEWQHTDFSSESAFRADAAAIMAADPGLAEPDHQTLALELRRTFPEQAPAR